jgi:Transcriptional antiterminator
MSDKYIEEYLIASAGVNIINQNLKINLPSSEIRNIALHFINAHTNVETTAVDLTKKVDFTKLIKRVLLRNNIFRTKSNRNYYDRFMVHLQYLEQRLNNMSADTKFDRKFELEMERDYPGSTSIAKQVSAEIKKARGVELNNKELLYFIIHIQRITQEDGLNDAR